ncbi:hypothetical protein JDN40_10165 [Rhodomicrobium vannielii ATCC 17100]|uniref:hypothetical protein n=1 Tax=Rhodomicrobium vannielii TaxID=1069 RepID=UPI0019198C55|nr:hypothetical protein [Rhodomicrobium vannielii]MBJ7534467.1 hypothetical protein [Rhodomicrobium vannielii ATCC 17100]
MWFRRIFRKPTPEMGEAKALPNVLPAAATARGEVVPEDGRYIEAAMTELVKVGLLLAPAASDDPAGVAASIAYECRGISFAGEPGLGHWALFALAGQADGPRPFENAIRFDDHCYDVAEASDYAAMISSIIAMAGDKWPVKIVEARNASDPHKRIEFGKPVAITIHAVPEIPPFELAHGKDFDWSVIFRLNERLPGHVEERFAIFLDGDATIVFLSPEDIGHLNALTGWEFFYLDS